MLYRRCGKRLLDLTVALVALVICAPILALVALLVRIRLGSPVLFRQARSGRAGRPFMVVKFRTMTEVRGADGVLLPDAERLTSFGRWLRKTSMDELPQLCNVFRGDMSLVGPRPLLAEYLTRYAPEQARRHEVRPGITGLAQIRGRGAIPFSQRLRYDIEYVDTYSFRLDCAIILQTLYLVGAGKLVEGSGQHVTVIDDVGLHPDTLKAWSQRTSGPGHGEP